MTTDAPTTTTAGPTTYSYVGPPDIRTAARGPAQRARGVRGRISLVREDFFVCVFCDGELPAHWNVAPPVA
ncbi:hypothetical protein ACWEO1_27995 [Kitasatospora cineracea]